jgi:hypothetical protein
MLEKDLGQTPPQTSCTNELLVPLLYLRQPPPSSLLPHIATLSAAVNPHRQWLPPELMPASSSGLPMTTFLLQQNRQSRKFKPQSRATHQDLRHSLTSEVHQVRSNLEAHQVRPNQKVHQARPNQTLSPSLANLLHLRVQRLCPAQHLSRQQDLHNLSQLASALTIFGSSTPRSTPHSSTLASYMTSRPTITTTILSWSCKTSVRDELTWSNSSAHSWTR